MDVRIAPRPTANWIALRSHRSSATVTAKKLAAEPQHASHLTWLEIELAANKPKLDWSTAELELKAELSAIEEDDQNYKRSDYEGTNLPVLFTSTYMVLCQPIL